MEVRVRSIRVRPLQSADLCFNLAGVLSHQFFERAALGAKVVAFDLATNLYPRLMEVDHDGRFVLDANGIRTLLAADAAPAPALFTVRNEGLAAALEQAIARRQNAFLTVYRHREAISAELARLYAGGDAPGSKLTLYKNLAAKEAERYTAIEDVYASAHDPSERGPSKLASVSRNEGDVVSTTRANTMSLASRGLPGESYKTLIHDDVHNQNVQTYTHDATVVVPEKQAVGELAYDPTTPPFVSQKTVTDSTSFKQTVYANEFKHPYLENQIRNLRIQLKIADDRLPETVFAMRLPHLAKIFENELLQLDLEVRKLQLNFAHTFLVSPIGGVITAIYKDLGESVAVGEAVVRVENDEVLLLAARVLSRDVITLGRTATITTGDLFRAGQRLTLVGPIVSIRGHDAQNNEWDIVIRCPNSQNPALRVPINYQFDRDDTVLTLA